MKDNRSFFERLTGSVRMDDTPEAEETISKLPKKIAGNGEDWSNTEEEGQLTIDVYQTPTEIIIKGTWKEIGPNTIEVTVQSSQLSITIQIAIDVQIDGDQIAFSLANSSVNTGCSAP